MSLNCTTKTAAFLVSVFLLIGCESPTKEVTKQSNTSTNTLSESVIGYWTVPLNQYSELPPTDTSKAVWIVDSSLKIWNYSFDSNGDSYYAQQLYFKCSEKDSLFFNEHMICAVTGKNITANMIILNLLFGNYPLTIEMSRYSFLYRNEFLLDSLNLVGSWKGFLTVYSDTNHNVRSQKVDTVSTLKIHSNGHTEILSSERLTAICFSRIIDDSLQFVVHDNVPLKSGFKLIGNDTLNVVVPFIYFNKTVSYIETRYYRIK
ncbi:MAG: hypothetical protein JNL74_18275 [Fibrobacteres bacterium]|nr:hypothetical protein [Fibrobacterota bacterium]